MFATPNNNIDSSETSTILHSTLRSFRDGCASLAFLPTRTTTRQYPSRDSLQQDQLAANTPRHNPLPPPPIHPHPPSHQPTSLLKHLESAAQYDLDEEARQVSKVDLDGDLVSAGAEDRDAHGEAGQVGDADAELADDEEREHVREDEDDVEGDDVEEPDGDDAGQGLFRGRGGRVGVAGDGLVVARLGEVVVVHGCGGVGIVVVV